MRNQGDGLPSAILLASCSRARVRAPYVDGVADHDGQDEPGGSAQEYKLHRCGHGMQQDESTDNSQGGGNDPDELDVSTPVPAGLRSGRQVPGLVAPGERSHSPSSQRGDPEGSLSLSLRFGRQARGQDDRVGESGEGNQREEEIAPGVSGAP